MPVSKEAVAAHLTPGDRRRIFSTLGLSIAGRAPNEEGWINGLKRPAALGHDSKPSFSINLQTGLW